jgi:tRNA (Thr-GGU) A37 N-methylase
MDELTLRPIGVVHAPVGGEMPIEGVAAQVEVHADYGEGLHDIESYTHVYMLGWRNQAWRGLLASDPAREACLGCVRPHGPIRPACPPPSCCDLKGECFTLTGSTW